MMRGLHLARDVVNTSTARLLATCVLLFAGCRPTGAREPAPPTEAPASASEAPPATSASEAPPPATASEAPTEVCADPETTFGGFAWVPAEVRAFVSVKLRYGELPTSLGTLKRSPHGHDQFGTDFDADLRDLRALLTAAKLDVGEALFFRARPDVSVWAVPGSCEPEAFARVAAALGLEVRVAPGPWPITFATGAAPNRFALVHNPSGGPLWLTGADQLGSVLAFIHGLSGDSWAECEQALRLDRPHAVIRVFQRTDAGGFRQHSISGTGLFTSGQIACVTDGAEE